MDNNIKITSIYLSAAFVCFILMAIIYIYSRKRIGEEIQVNTGYAVGILRSMGGTGRPSITIAYFDFEVNGKDSKRMKSRGKLTYSKGAKIGNKYLVIYDTLNMENCTLLFDYPIKDSTDFIRYLEEFKTKPLDFDKYF